MGPQLINNHPALVAQVLFIMLFLFPDFSLLLWKDLMKKWSRYRQWALLTRSRKTEEKLRHYWVIDVRKLK